MNTKLITGVIIVVILVLAGYAWFRQIPVGPTSTTPTPYVPDETYQPVVI